MKFSVRSSLAFLAAALPALGQHTLELPRQSPAASVSQTFGYTTVTVTYSRPAVNGRVIWGGVVPYGTVWRAGANEPTLAAFSRDVVIEGNSLPAGTYALFVLPEQNGGKDAWTFIFSRETKGWGAFGYDPKDDALRVTVTPEKAPHEERMAFSFDDVTDGGVTLNLGWGKLRAGLAITADYVETGRARIEDWLPHAPDDNPFPWLHAARFTWTHAAAGSAGDADRSRALEWVDRSIDVRPVFANLWAKANMLAETGRCDAAAELVERARATAGSNVSETSQLPAPGKTARWCAALK